MIGTKILSEQKSKYNGNLRVVRSWGLRTYIQSNGLTQSGGVVETFWRQTLRRVKSKRLKAKAVLILGLGGGTVAKLVRKFWPDAKITGIEIDPIMIELGTRYLGLGTSETKIVIRDALKISKELKVKDKKYDLIIVDLYNGDQFPRKFSTKNHIRLVMSLLSRSGIVIFNRLYYKDKKAEAEKFGERLKTIFSQVEVFRPVANMMFICK